VPATVAIGESKGLTTEAQRGEAATQRACAKGMASTAPSSAFGTFSPS